MFFWPAVCSNTAIIGVQEKEIWFVNLTSKFPVLSTSCMGRFESCTHTVSSVLQSPEGLRNAAGSKENSVRWDLAFVSPLEGCRFTPRAQISVFVWFAKPFLDFPEHPGHWALHPNVRTGSSEHLALHTHMGTALCLMYKHSSAPDCSFSSSVTGLKAKFKRGRAGIKYSKCSLLPFHR